MIKHTMYPKTTRIGNEKTNIIITEKLDGSNLGFANVNGRLLVAQRNNIYFYDELKNDGSEKLYKGLHAWLKENHEELLKSIFLNSVVFGEWIGMGKISYGLEKRFYMFAKARVEWKEEETYPTVSKIIYNPELLKYAFNEQVLPSFVGQVPLVEQMSDVPSVKELDELYARYTENKETKVEGFVIIINNETIKKYVRFKDGKESPHKA